MKTLACILPACLLTACAFGAAVLKNETAESINSFLIDGRTTRQEVSARFGRPGDVDTAGSETTWVYVYSAEAPGGTTDKELFITFDAQGVLVRHALGERY